MRLRSLVATLAVAMAIASSGGPVSGQSAADPLVASLLTASDLPDGFASDGIVEGSAYNIDEAAFTGNDGVRVVSQVWRSPSGVLFDFRMAFDSPEAASAYLAAASPVLSEAAASALEPGDDVVPGADDTLHYRGEAPLSETATVIIDNYLVRVGPVTAKVFFGGVDYPEGTALTMATGAVARMASIPAAADLGASVSTSPSAAAPPAAEDPTTALLSVVPPAIADSCRPLEPSGQEVAVVGCSSGDGFQAVFASFASAADMDDGFDAMAATAGELPEAGSCTTGPHAGANTLDGVEVGRVACWVMNGRALVAATDERNTLITLAIGADGDLPSLAAWWFDLRSTP